MQFTCPLCAGLFQIDASMSGGQVMCPNCQGAVTIPDQTPPPAAPPMTAEASQLSCPVCAGVFQVTPEMAGQQVACPHCQNAVMVPAGPAAPMPQISAAGSEPAAPAPLPPPAEPPPAETPPEEAVRASPEIALEDKSGAGSQESNLYPPGFQPKSGDADRSDARPSDAKPDGDVAPDSRYPPAATAATPPSGEMPVAAGQDSAGKRNSPAASAPPVPPADTGGKIDSLLPPGASPAPSETKENFLLPPGGESVASKSEVKTTTDDPVDAKMPPAAAGTAAKKKSKADSLLPPGAESSPSDSGPQQRALPESETNRPVKVESDLVIPTEDGGVVKLHEPERTVGTGARKVSLHSLSLEEKSKRRALKSLVVWVLCALVLGIALILLID